MVNAVSKVMNDLAFGRVKQIGKRNCEHCGAVVPIMQRVDSDGNATEHSICLACDTTKTKQKLKLPTVEELETNKNLLKAEGFSKKYEKVPHDLANKKFKDFITENDSEKLAKKIVMNYSTSFGKSEYHSLILRGECGIGKSHLAYCASKLVQTKGITSMFLRTDDLLSLIRSTYNPKSSLSEEDVFEMIAALDLFVLDEVGGEYSKKDANEFESWASEKILKVVDIRQSKPMIMTLNYTSDELIQKYGKIQGQRIVSRMMSGAKVVIIEGRDRRMSSF